MISARILLFSDVHFGQILREIVVLNFFPHFRHGRSFIASLLNRSSPVVFFSLISCFLSLLIRPVGIEPTSTGLEVRCLIHSATGADGPGAIRTHIFRIKNPAFYPLNHRPNLIGREGFEPSLLGSKIRCATVTLPTHARFPGSSLSPSFHLDLLLVGVTGFEPASLLVPNQASYQIGLHPDMPSPLPLSLTVSREPPRDDGDCSVKRPCYPSTLGLSAYWLLG